MIFSFEKQKWREINKNINLAVSVYCVCNSSFSIDIEPIIIYDVAPFLRISKVNVTLPLFDTLSAGL